MGKIERNVTSHSTKVFLQPVNGDLEVVNKKNHHFERIAKNKATKIMGLLYWYEKTVQIQ